MKNPFRNVVTGIKNLITWFPVIWNDRQWDHCYFYELLHKKLTLMEKFFREKGIHLYAEKDADNIKYAILILNRIIKDNYYDNAFKPHRKKYGESHFLWNDIKDSKYKELEIVYDRDPKTDKEKEKEKRLHKQCIEREIYLKNQDLEMFFRHLRKHMNDWWD